MSNEVYDRMHEMYPRMLRFALKRTGNSVLADDLCQAACEKALRMSAEYKPGTVLLSWLFSIVDSVYIDMVRYEARRNTFSLEHVENFAARSDVDSRIGMIDLSRLITKLPPHMQEILTVRYVEQNSQQEAAKKLKIRKRTVMSRTFRAQHRLRELRDQ